MHKCVIVCILQVDLEYYILLCPSGCNEVMVRVLHIMDENTKYLIALSLLKGIGPITAKNLIAHVGEPQKIFTESTRSLLKIPNIGQLTVDVLRDTDEVFRRADEEIEFMQRYGIEPVSYIDNPRYPERLLQCDDSPIVLYVKGEVDLNRQKVLSIVGTRQPSEEGKEICERIVADLAANHPDLLIVSGLAYGIDICAHRSAMRSNVATVAVLAHGLDIIYPSAHREAARQLLETGALITEYPSQTKPDAPNFVARNRIVAGISAATMVVESGEKGGSLITANMASSYSREVFAVPGSPKHDKSRGCNALIKRNIASLVESAEDIEKELNWTNKNTEKAVQPSLFAQPANDEEKSIYSALLVENELTASVLSSRCKMPVSKINTLLLGMEFSGLVKSLPGNRYRLCN